MSLPDAAVENGSRHRGQARYGASWVAREFTLGGIRQKSNLRENGYRIAGRVYVFPGFIILTATILILPILIPPLILGVAMLGLLSRLGLHGQLYSSIIAHTLLLTAPAMAIIQLRLAQMPPTLEEAAWDLGANELQTVWRVVLPWALPGIAGGWLLAFTFSFDEFIIAQFVSGFDQTLPVTVYNVMIASYDPSPNAIGTIVFGLLLLTLLGAELLIIPLFMRRRRS